MSKPQLRRIFVLSLLVALSAAALMGIWTLLSGSFSDTSSKILLTTLAIGLFSVLSLCNLTVLDTKVGLFGVAGIIVSGLMLLLAIDIVWAVDDWFDAGAEVIWKLFYITLVLGVGVAHQSLLLPVTQRRTGAPSFVALLTVACVAIVAALLIIPVFAGWDLEESYWRIVGVFAILDVLGTVVTPVLAKLQKSASPSPTKIK